MTSQRPALLALCSVFATTVACVGDAATEDVATQASALDASFTALTLVNGWTNAPYSTSPAAVALVSGVVQLKGAIATGGTNASPFTLPAGFRPSATVYVPVNLCNATKGRLQIATSGIVTVVAEGNTWGNAQCFTSLEGVSFALDETGYTPLTLKNGWSNYGTRNAAAINNGNIIHLAGAIKTGGTNKNAFRVPSGMEPSANVYLPIDLCAGAKGRLFIDIGGEATIDAEGGLVWSNAQCFTSLEGVSYAWSPESGQGFTGVTLQNGWIGMPYSTRVPNVKNISGIVHMLGAIKTDLGNPVPFTLPAGFRPPHDAYIEVDMCNAAQGRIWIQTDGTVTVQAKNGYYDASCFTSVEGVTFSTL
jgi:hypothetical protein